MRHIIARDVYFDANFRQVFTKVLDMYKIRVLSLLMVNISGKCSIKCKIMLQIVLT